MEDRVVAFYEHLAPEYHLLFGDWRGAVLRQGEILDRFIRAHLAPPPRAVLDCSCGIGTQAIGLARRGYRVHGTDLSPAAVARAWREAATFGVAPTWGVADLRKLDRQVEGAFDLVLSCDNALPHLLSDEELRRAAPCWSASATTTGSRRSGHNSRRRACSTAPRAGGSSSSCGSGARTGAPTPCTNS